VLRRLTEQVKETDVSEERHIALVANVISEWDRGKHFAQRPSILRGPLAAQDAVIFASH
jgi:hypothetical protein